jgi:hypothetical protein
MKAATPPFYLVWNPEGHSPTHRHDTQDEAEREAKRLARLCPEHTFFVLQPISAMKKRDVDVERFERLHELDDEIPF